MNDSKHYEIMHENVTNKKVVIITNNISNVNDFSGVPYFLSSVLKKKGYIVQVINIPFWLSFIEKICSYTITRIVNYYCYFRFKQKGQYNFSYSYVFSLLFTILMKANKAILNDCDFIISIRIPYHLKSITNKPVFLFADATIESNIRRAYKRDLLPPELNQMRRSVKTYVKHTDHIYCLFKEVKDEIDGYLGFSTKTSFIGNVLNIENTDFRLCDDDLQKKFSNKIIFFIGRKHYWDGAIKLAEAYEILRYEGFGVKLVFVGVSRSIFKAQLEDVEFIPDLNKGNLVDYNKYREVLMAGTIFLNPSKMGGAYMTTLESCFYYNPYILTNYPEISSFLMGKSQGGLLIESSLSAYDLAQLIKKLLSDYAMWLEYSHNARKLVDNSSWENLVAEIEREELHSL